MPSIESGRFVIKTSPAIIVSATVYTAVSTAVRAAAVFAAVSAAVRAAAVFAIATRISCVTRSSSLLTRAEDAFSPGLIPVPDKGAVSDGGAAEKMCKSNNNNIDISEMSLDGDNNTIYTRRNRNRISVNLFVAATISMIAPAVTDAQALQPVDHPLLIVNGSERQGWPEKLAIPSFTDSVSALIAFESTLVEYYRLDGFLAAHVDSITTTGSGTTIYFQTGSQSHVGGFSVTGIALFSEEETRSYLDVFSGDVFRILELELGIDRLLKAYSARSYKMVEINIEKMDAGGDGDTNSQLTVDIHLDIIEGAATILAGLQLPGADRTRTSFVIRELGLSIGAPFYNVELSPLEDKIRESGLFESVGPAFIEVYPDSTLVLSIPVEEGPPGTFDFVLGFLPASNSESSGQLIGSGHLDLLNPFGYGRTFEIALDRLPGQKSSGRVRFADPQIAGIPIRIDVAFEGYQRDSTYSQQSLSFELAYRFDAGVRAGLRYSRESTSPGQAGNQLVGPVQRIPTSTRAFWGLTAYVRHLDNPMNPRQGFYVDTILESGSKNESRLVVLPGADTTTVLSSHRQERLKMILRAHFSMFSTQSLVLGSDILVLRSQVYSESDLFRIGGASSLRGYDEERFLANIAIRMLSEYRVLLDQYSYAFVFLEVAYLERPQISTVPGSSGWYPGYGVGMQWRTAAGLLKASYAINNEDGPSRGRIHLGLSFGL